MKTIFFSLTVLLISFQIDAQSIEGRWKTIDDNSGKERSIVEIYKKGNKYYGKILNLFREPGEDPDPICDKCDEDDSRFKKKVIGMEIIQEMEFDEKDNEYVNGTILDPENGNVYDCKLWIGDDGNLKVRGYVAFFFRTQTWLPVSGR